jgi:enolase-phosphatase E1
VSPLTFDTQINIILLDIEGTTTPVDFVYKTLFPYASNRIESFLREHIKEPEILSIIDQLYRHYQIDKVQETQLQPWTDETCESLLHSAIAYCQWLMSKDIKNTALKSLQGKIWEEGYNKGALRGIVYPDVPPAFERWRQQKREICIYSSGSILAQKLLFSTVSSGDLTPHIAAFFDTGIGHKTSTESYRKIAQSLARNPSDFLFVSDSMKELRAAHDATMHTILCNRDLRSPELSKERAIVESFHEIFPDR